MATFVNAEETQEDRLFQMLQNATPLMAMKIERHLFELWSNSGNATWDKLLKQSKKLIHQKDYQNAIDRLTVLTQIAPEFAEGWNTRATTWYLMGKYESSLSDIVITLKLNPRHFGALFGTGMIMEKYGWNAMALIIYQDVAELHPRRNQLSETIERLQKKMSGKST